MIEIKKDAAHTVIYTPPKFKHGVTVTMEVFDEAGVEIAGSPFTMSELADPEGVYTQAFTPDAKGDWLVVCWYGSDLGKIDIRYKVTDNDIDDLATGTQISGLDAKIDLIKASTDNLPGDPAGQAAVDASIAAAVSSIKGGSETLESLKNRIDEVEQGGRII